MNVFIDQRPYNDFAELWFREHANDTYITVVKEIILETIQVEPGSWVSLEDVAKPFKLNTPEVQGLFNQLWLLGYRPKGESLASQEHIQAHLTDMRKLVSHFTDCSL